MNYASLGLYAKRKEKKNAKREKEERKKERKRIMMIYICFFLKKIGNFINQPIASSSARITFRMIEGQSSLQTSSRSCEMANLVIPWATIFASHLTW